MLVRRPLLPPCPVGPSGGCGVGDSQLRQGLQSWPSSPAAVSDQRGPSLSTLPPRQAMYNPPINTVSEGQGVYRI